ncbi:hypothetical protein FD754_013216 [Muntiacus muntjak]|uniref:Uncharacterized protein n=1 Tax=Muntiacus muntjak TaxID=9888 RepID=A0A5N3VGF7_MUNMU|nr:hypothetical protein FD754_013216 [Muntiacus muntjak]
MATVEPETTPTPNPPPTEEEKTECSENRWALRFFKNDISKTWQANLRLISKFDTLSSNLMPGCDYSLFKDGIEPIDLDIFWLETLLCLIGESFDDYSDDVCGAAVNVRAKGRVYKERLELPPKIVICYQSHAATKTSSTTKNWFVV